ncbi:MAG: hypothetical protein PHE89_04210 [Alphaproteobacteria bacterium]|nr:hypothetical protein [Alphaproteobacteria bacterium]
MRKQSKDKLKQIAILVAYDVSCPKAQSRINNAVKKQCKEMYDFKSERYSKKDDKYLKLPASTLIWTPDKEYKFYCSQAQKMFIKAVEDVYKATGLSIKITNLIATRMEKRSSLEPQTIPAKKPKKKS